MNSSTGSSHQFLTKRPLFERFLHLPGCLQLWGDEDEDGASHHEGETADGEADGMLVVREDMTSGNGSKRKALNTTGVG